MKRTKKTFADFASGAKTASTVTLSPELQKIMISLETLIGSASNEGDLFPAATGPGKMIDVSDVTLEACEKAGVIEDIRKVFTEVARHEMDEYNKREGVNAPIAYSNMPGSKIVIKKLSNGVLPTALSRRNGLIYINENFVKVMYKLAGCGLRGDRNVMGKVVNNVDKGAMFSQWGNQGFGRRFKWNNYLGNLYFSILYSIAIHEIRGHFVIRDGVAVLNLDEEYAQGERGLSSAIPNVAAIEFFWQVIVGENRRSVLADHPELYRYFTAGERQYAGGVGGKFKIEDYPLLGRTTTFTNSPLIKFEEDDVESVIKADVLDGLKVVKLTPEEKKAETYRILRPAIFRFLTNKTHVAIAGGGEYDAREIAEEIDSYIASWPVARSIYADNCEILVTIFDKLAHNARVVSSSHKTTLIRSGRVYKIPRMSDDEANAVLDFVMGLNLAEPSKEQIMLLAKLAAMAAMGEDNTMLRRAIMIEPHARNFIPHLRDAVIENLRMGNVDKAFVDTDEAANLVLAFTANLKFAFNSASKPDLETGENMAIAKNAVDRVRPLIASHDRQKLPEIMKGLVEGLTAISNSSNAFAPADQKKPADVSFPSPESVAAAVKRSLANPAVAQAVQLAEDALEKLKLALTAWDIEMYAWDSCKPVTAAIDVAAKEGDIDSAYYVIEKSIDVIRDRGLRLDTFAKLNKKSLAMEHISRASAIAEQASALMNGHDDGIINEISQMLHEAFKAIAAASDELAPSHRKARRAVKSAAPAVVREIQLAEDALEKLKLAVTAWDTEMYAWDSCGPVKAAIDTAVKEGDIDSAYYVIEKSIGVIRDSVLRLDKFAKIMKRNIAIEHISRASAVAEQASVLMNGHDDGKISEISQMLHEAFKAIAAASDEMAPPQKKAHHADEEAFGAVNGSNAVDGGLSIEDSASIPAKAGIPSDEGDQASANTKMDSGLPGNDEDGAQNAITQNALRIHIFELLAAPERPVLTAEAIASQLEIKQDKMLIGALAELVQMGALYKLSKPKEQPQGAIYYSVSLMRAQQAEAILTVLRDSRDTQEPVDDITLKSGVYKILEPSWASVLANEVTKGPAAKAASITGQKMVFVIETDWIPSEQQSFVAGLVQEIEKMGDKGAFLIIRASSKDVKTKLMETLQKENLTMDRAIILASKDTVWNKDFAPLVSRSNEDKTKPFVFAVDPKDLKSDSYVRVVQMMLIALRLTTTQLSCNVFRMKIQKYNDRLFLIMPSADPMSFDDMKKIYDEQRALIQR